MLLILKQFLIFSSLLNVTYSKIRHDNMNVITQNISSFTLAQRIIFIFTIVSKSILIRNHKNLLFNRRYCVIIIEIILKMISDCSFRYKDFSEMFHPFSFPYHQ